MLSRVPIAFDQQRRRLEPDLPFPQAHEQLHVVCVRGMRRSPRLYGVHPHARQAEAAIAPALTRSQPYSATTGGCVRGAWRVQAATMRLAIA